MKHFVALLVVLVFQSTVVQRSNGCWMALDPGMYTERCPIIVSGTITRIDVAKSGKDRDDDTAHIEIAAIHKNLLKDVALKPGGLLPVKMASVNNKVVASTDLRYPVGATAIWLVELAPDGGSRIDSHPVQKQPADKPVPVRPRLAGAGNGKANLSVTAAKWPAQRKAAEDKERQEREQEQARQEAHQRQVHRLAGDLAGKDRLQERDLRLFDTASEAVRRDIFKLRDDEVKLTEASWLALCAHALQHDPSDNIRTAAAVRLAAFGKGGSPPLLGALQDRSESVRLFACQSLMQIEDRTAAEPIAKLLSDKSKQVRLMAVRTLGRLGSLKHLEAVLRLQIQDGGIDEDWQFADALARLGEKKVALRCVVNSMKSTNWNVRHFAVQALTLIDSEAVVPAVIPLLAPELKRTTAEIREHRICDRVFVGLTSELESRTGQKFGTNLIGWLAWWDKESVRLKLPVVDIDKAAVRALQVNYRLEKLLAGQHEVYTLTDLAAVGPDGIADLVRALNSPNETIRSQVIAALGEIGHASAIPPLLTLVQKKDKLALNALRAVGNIGGADAASAILRHAADFSPETRLSLLDTVARIGDLRVVEHLLPYLQSLDPWLRRGAVAILGRFRDPRVRSALAKLITDDPDWRVYRAAKQSLAEQDGRSVIDWPAKLDIAIVRCPDPPEGAEAYIRRLREEEAKAPPPPKDLPLEEVAKIFAKGGTGGGREELAHFVTDRERARVVQYIVEHCRRNDTACDDVIEAILEYLCNIKENTDVRLRAKALLVKIGSPALPAVVNGLVRGDDQLRKHCAEVLLELNHPTAVKYIQRHLPRVTDADEKARLQGVIEKIQTKQP